MTQILTDSGALTRGFVKAIDVDVRQRELSTIVKIQASYTKGSQGQMPDRLFLKMVTADMEDEYFGRSEVDYYTRDYMGLKEAPIVRCYHAAYSEELKRYHVLMDDLSNSHTTAAGKRPTVEYAFALAEGLALCMRGGGAEKRLSNPVNSCLRSRGSGDL